MNKGKVALSLLVASLCCAGSGGAALLLGDALNGDGPALPDLLSAAAGDAADPAAARQQIAGMLVVDDEFLGLEEDKPSPPAVEDEADQTDQVEPRDALPEDAGAKARAARIRAQSLVRPSGGSSRGGATNPSGGSNAAIGAGMGTAVSAYPPSGPTRQVSRNVRSRGLVNDVYQTRSGHGNLQAIDAAAISNSQISGGVAASAGISQGDQRQSGDTNRQQMSFGSVR